MTTKPLGPSFKLTKGGKIVRVMRRRASVSEKIAAKKRPKLKFTRENTMSLAETIELIKPPLKGRARRRSNQRSLVSRRSVLLDLATPVPSSKGTVRRLSPPQEMAARLLDSDLAARWGNSKGLVPDACRPSSGDGPISRTPVDFEAANRIQQLTQYLHPPQRALLGALQAINHTPGGHLTKLPIHTGHDKAELHMAALVGHLRAFLDSVAEFYRLAIGLEHGHWSGSRLKGAA